MAFQEKVLSLGTLETLLFECPATLAGSAHGIVFSNITNADKTIAVKLYTKSTGLTTTIAQDREVKANSEFPWPKPINLASGDQLIAMASTLNSVTALVSIYLAASQPASVGFNLRGEHSIIATYDPNDVVSIAGSSYLALYRNQNSPPPSANWMVSALKGDKGDAGVSVAVLDEGGQLTAAAASLNFTGGGVTATVVGGAVTVNVPSVTRGTLGVDQVDNTPDVNKPVSIAQQAALDAKASLGYVAAAVAQGKADLVASSPAALDTLNELAIALGNDANFAATTAAALGSRVRVDAAQALTGPQQAQGRSNLGLAAVAASGAKADVGLGNVDNTSDANKPVSTAQATAIALKVDTAAKDASGGIPGLTLFKLNLRNALNTFTSFLINANTAARTYTLQDRDGTLADDTDLATKLNKAGGTLVGGIITGYTETYQSPAPGAAITLDPSLGTFIELVTTANCTITLPAAAPGKSYTLWVTFGGVHTLTFAGGTSLKWAGGAAPTATSVAGKTDIYVFAANATKTCGRTGGSNY